MKFIEDLVKEISFRPGVWKMPEVFDILECDTIFLSIDSDGETNLSSTVPTINGGGPFAEIFWDNTTGLLAVVGNYTGQLFEGKPVVLLFTNEEFSQLFEDFI